MKFFIYGSSFMKKGRFHQYYLGGKTCLGNGCIDGYTKYILGSVDGIVPKEGERVEGELYDIDQSTVNKMDFIMQDGPIFHKDIVEVELENGEVVQATTYIWNGNVG